MRTMAGQRGKRRRYDGFQPLGSDETQGLESAFYSDEEEGDDDAGSNTIVDIRNFGLPGGQPNHPKSPPPKPAKTNGTTASSHHIDT